MHVDCYEENERQAVLCGANSLQGNLRRYMAAITVSVGALWDCISRVCGCGGGCVGGRVPLRAVRPRSWYDQVRSRTY